MVAGVAGGVGRQLGIDPLILRVLLVVLAFFGGAGIMLYALGWLLLDVDDGLGRSLLEDAFDAHTPSRARNLFTVAALVLTIFISSIWVLSGQAVPGVLVVLTVIGLYMYARRDERQPARYAYAGFGGTPYAPAQPMPPSEQAGPAPQPYQGQPYQGQPYESQDPAVGLVPPGPPPSTSRFGRDRSPQPPRPPRERSYLGLLTISVVILALGVLAAVDVGGAEVPGSAYVALSLGIVALGLLAGGWVGRSRGLIVAGVFLSAALVPATVLDAATDDNWSELGRWSNSETLRETPTTVGAIQPAYDIGSGRLVLDLRDVDFTGADVRTSITMGAGEVLVLVPAEVDVVAAGSVDLGDLVLLDVQSSGVDANRQVTDAGLETAAGSADGELDLTIDVNVGRAEVRRS